MANPGELRNTTRMRDIARPVLRAIAVAAFVTTLAVSSIAAPGARITAPLPARTQPSVPRVPSLRLSALPMALPKDARIHIREEWPLGARGVARWGTWTLPGNRDKRAAYADGDFIYVEYDGRIGGSVTGLGTHDVLLAPAGNGRVRMSRAFAPAAQLCDEQAAANSSDNIWAIPPSVLRPRASPLRPLDLLVLYTPRALIDAGGSREHLKHCLDAALSTANEAFGAPETNITFHRRALVPVPTDDAGQSLHTIWRRLREPTSPRFGQLAAALHHQLRPDAILLITGRRAERCHGYASPPRTPAEPAFAVVPITELRHGDLTLAHELGHCVGLEHRSDEAAASSVMGTGSPRRRREAPLRQRSE